MSDPRYATRDDINLRLNNTVVMYKNRFGFVQLADSGLSVCFREYSEEGAASRQVTVDANSPELVINSPSLGYAQLNSYNTFYATRTPIRRQKQGLAADNLSFWHVDGELLRGSNDFFGSAPFFSMLYGKYMPKKAIMSLMVKSEKDDCAPKSPSFALSKSFACVGSDLAAVRLLRANTEIGVLSMKGGFIKLHQFWEGDSIILENIATELGEYTQNA